MATNIKYTNFSEVQITEQQLPKISRYKKVTEIDDVTKTVEEYNDNKINLVNYYLDSDESNLVALEMLRDTYPHCNCFKTFEKTTYGDYTIELERSYSMDEDTPYITKVLFDVDNQIICTEKSTLGEAFLVDDTHQLESVRTKYLYDHSHYLLNFTFSDGHEYSDFQVLEAHYKPDGSLDYIDYGDIYAHERKTFAADEYSTLVIKCGLSAAQEAYYLTDVFLPAD